MFIYSTKVIKNSLSEVLNNVLQYKKFKKNILLLIFLYLAGDIHKSLIFNIYNYEKDNVPYPVYAHGHNYFECTTER